MPHRRLIVQFDDERFVLLRAVAGKAEEKEHDADVDDIAAVTPFVAADETDEGGEEIGARRAAPHVAAAPELLDDRRGDECAQREAQARRPDLDAERLRYDGGCHRSRNRPDKL